MPTILKATDVKQQENKLQLELQSSFTGIESELEEISEYTLCGLINFELKNTIYQLGKSQSHIQIIYFKMTKIVETNNHVYTIKMSSEMFKIPERVYYCVDDEVKTAAWQVFHHNFKVSTEFDIKLTFKIWVADFNGLSPIAGDTELTDFKLQGIDGTIEVHRAVLAAFSPVLRDMIKNATNKCILIPNTNKETLQHLKDYLYEQKLPETGLDKLAAISSYYNMKDLQDRITVKFLTMLTAENTKEILAIAVKYNMNNLIMGVLEIVQRDAVKVADIKNWEMLRDTTTN